MVGGPGLCTESLRDPGSFHLKVPSSPGVSGPPLDSLHPAGGGGKREHHTPLVRTQPCAPCLSAGDSGNCGLPTGPGEMENRFKGDLTSSLPHRGENSYFGNTNASSSIVQMTEWRLKNVKGLALGYTCITWQSLDFTPSQRLCGNHPPSVP